MKPATGYSNRPTSDDPRDVEAWGLTEAARRLIHARQAPEDQDMLRKALYLNQRLWTIFQAAVTEPECPLPMDVRQHVLALSIIVDRQTFDRLRDLDVNKLDRLIDINRAVASGLSQRPATAEQPAKAAPSMPTMPATPGKAAPASPPADAIRRLSISI